MEVQATFCYLYYTLIDIIQKNKNIFVRETSMKRGVEYCNLSCIVKKVERPQTNVVPCHAACPVTISSLTVFNPALFPCFESHVKPVVQ